MGTNKDAFIWRLLSFQSYKSCGCYSKQCKQKSKANRTIQLRDDKAKTKITFDPQIELTDLCEMHWTFHSISSYRPLRTTYSGRLIIFLILFSFMDYSTVHQLSIETNYKWSYIFLVHTSKISISADLHGSPLRQCKSVRMVGLFNRSSSLISRHF